MDSRYGSDLRIDLGHGFPLSPARGRDLGERVGGSVLKSQNTIREYIPEHLFGTCTKYV